jgi:hypothetical protein
MPYNVSARSFNEISDDSCFHFWSFEMAWCLRIQLMENHPLFGLGRIFDSEISNFSAMYLQVNQWYAGFQEFFGFADLICDDQSIDDIFH